MKYIVATLILMISSFDYASTSGWDVSIHEDWATLYDTHKGDLSLAEAVSSVPKNIWLRNFRVFLSEDDHILQKELQQFLSAK